MIVAYDLEQYSMLKLGVKICLSQVALRHTIDQDILLFQKIETSIPKL